MGWFGQPELTSSVVTSGPRDAGLGAVQRTDETLDVRPAHRAVSGVALRLNVDAVEPQWVLLDNAVQTFVAGPSQTFG